MKIEHIREKIIATSLKMLSDQLTNGTAGNISIYDRSENLIAITPSGIPYSLLKPEDVSVVDLDGNLIEGKTPSSELEMHLMLYRNRNNINAVIHGHTKYSTAIACLRKNLPAIDYMIAVTGDKEVRCANYASYGTKELAENCFNTMRNSRACLLANHGITTAGEDIEIAYNVLTQVEYISSLYLLSSSVGEPVIIEDEEIYNMIERFKDYGKKIK
ncbi:L-fuculose-phosphate aldolase [Cetobacterium somerae]|uniref:L-fuculose-phosphate aldolase n=1 Tax=Cetobacterium sp. NK01 TaxID=2993530 RepID=UPI002116E7D8|nr:L-fuculose-phosphate aldolase [Cetobacterium sp. NK01]MCQ8212761.1 L-fuculose-phosphate aldolase [Cetobacterium sp. NK01]